MSAGEGWKKAWRARLFSLGDMTYDPNNEGLSDEAKELMVEHDIDEDVAERAQELIDDGLDETDAVELAEEGI